MLTVLIQLVLFQLQSWQELKFYFSQLSTYRIFRLRGTSLLVLSHASALQHFNFHATCSDWFYRRESIALFYCGEKSEDLATAMMEHSCSVQILKLFHSPKNTSIELTVYFMCLNAVRNMYFSLFQRVFSFTCRQYMDCSFIICLPSFVTTHIRRHSRTVRFLSGSLFSVRCFEKILPHLILSEQNLDTEPKCLVLSDSFRESTVSYSKVLIVTVALETDGRVSLYHMFHLHNCTGEYFQGNILHFQNV